MGSVLKCTVCFQYCQSLCVLCITLVLHVILVPYLGSTYVLGLCDGVCVDIFVGPVLSSVLGSEILREQHYALPMINCARQSTTLRPC